MDALSFENFFLKTIKQEQLDYEYLDTDQGYDDRYRINNPMVMTEKRIEPIERDKELIPKEAALKTFLNVAIKEEPEDYVEYSDTNYVYDEINIKNEATELVAIKEEIQEEPDDFNPVGPALSSIEIGLLHDHAYENFSQIYTNIEFTGQSIIKMEINTEANNFDSTELNLQDLENYIKKEPASIPDDILIEEIINNFPITNETQTFHDSLDNASKRRDMINDTDYTEFIKIKIKKELIIDEMSYDKDYTEFTKNKLIKDIYKCKYCFYTFHLLSDLQTHMEKHFIKNTFKCKSCDEVFDTMRDLITHKYILCKRNTYKCNSCDKVFSIAKVYKKHLKIHKQDININNQCSICDKVLPTIRGYKCHVRFCRYECKSCKQKFALKCNYEDHMISCSRAKENAINTEINNENSVKELHVCKCCSETFLYESNHTLSSTYNCSKCGKIFVDLKNKYLGMFLCDKQICKNSLKYYCDTCDHDSIKDVLKEEPLLSKYAEKSIYACDFCNECFSCEWDKFKHTFIQGCDSQKTDANINIYQNSSNENIFKKPSVPHVQQVDTTYKCKSCFKKFSKHVLLIKHVEKAHPNQRLFLCDHCDRKFFYQRSLIAHLEKDHGVTKLKCDISLNIVRNKFKIPHKKIIKSTFECRICGESFANAVIRKTHLRTHDKHVQFECNICDETFKRLQDQEAHIKKHSTCKFGNFVCDLCDKKFISQSTYNRHMIVHKE